MKLLSYTATAFIGLLLAATSSQAQLQEVWRWSDSALWQNEQRVIDDSGNIFLAQIQVISPGVYNYKVTTISSSGALLWNTTWDYSNTGQIRALNVDPLGIAYSVGNNKTGDRIVYSKHNADGSYLWSTSVTLADSTGMAFGRVTSNGTMFAGLIRQSVVGPPAYNCIKRNERGSCKWYNSSGSVISEYTSPSSGININGNQFRAMDTDDFGFIYLQNWIETDTCFNWTTCERDCNTMNDSLYFTKLTSAGTVIYRKGGLSENTASAVTSSGNVYMTTAGDILAKYDQQGALLWTGSLPANTWWYEIMVDPSENGVKVFSYVNDYSRYYITSYKTDGTLQWHIAGPTANHSSAKKCLDYSGNLYLSNAPNTTIDRFNNATGAHDWQYSADSSRILQMKAISGGDLIVIRTDHIQRLTPTPSLTVLDANADPLGSQDLYLIRVADNAPHYTEDTLGIVKTDSSGKIELKPR